MIPQWLSLIDVAFVGVAVLFALAGYQKGFAGQVAHILTFVVLGITLFFFYPAVFSYMGRLFRSLDETYMMWLILAGLGVLAILFFKLVSKLLANVMKMQITDKADRNYGFVLGLIRGALLALFAMIFLVILGPPKFYDAFRMKSRVGKLVCYEMVPSIQPHMTRGMLEERVDKLKEALIYQKEGGKLE
ncbi:MAG: CvpA family protein [Kiritimatiellales bacterium]|nr:CvpA family protein [Kiritimatiellales bacterium]MCF7863345.1 CvpA family protein [Kiritimatiellales bacterium]